MFNRLIKHSFLCTIFIFISTGILSKIPFPEIEILDPIGETLQDFDITDIAYSKIKGYNHKNNQENFTLNEEQGDTNVILVNIGEQPRGVIGDIINEISKCKPKVIGIDAIFKFAKEDTAGDQKLVNAIKNAGNVIIACKFKFDTEHAQMYLEKSHPMFSTVTANSYVNVVTDGSDDIAKYKTSRSFYPYKIFENTKMNYFAIDLVKKYNPEKAQKFIKRNNEIEYINYVGNIGTFGDITEYSVPKFTAIEHSAVLNKEFDPSLFENKIVILGFMGRNLGDEDIEDIFYSPLNEKYIGKTNPDMFGVVIHANIINMIVNENYVDTVPFWLELIIAFIICYISVFILYSAFLKYPMAYGTISKIIQLFVWVTVLFSIVGIYYNQKIKYDTTIVVVLVALAGDLVEIYHEVIIPFFLKLFNKLNVKKVELTKQENNSTFN